MFSYFMDWCNRVLEPSYFPAVDLSHEEAMAIELKNLVEALPQDALARKQYFALITDYDLLMKGYREMQGKLSIPVTYFSVFGE